MASFNANYRGIGQLLKSPEMAKAMHDIATGIKSRAVAFSPVDKGGFKSSWKVESRKRPDRVVAVVVNDDPAAVQIEFGTKDTPRHRALGKAIGSKE